MSEEIRDLHPVEAGMLIGRTKIVRKVLGEEGLDLGTAPYAADSLDDAWERIVVHPVDPDAIDWVVGSFGGLLIEHFQAKYSFKLKELIDEHGASICLIETRTGIQLFPFDAVIRRINEKAQRPFATYLSQMDDTMQQYGLAARTVAT